MNGDNLWSVTFCALHSGIANTVVSQSAMSGAGPRRPAPPREKADGPGQRDLILLSLQHLAQCAFSLGLTYWIWGLLKGFNASVCSPTKG